MKINWGTGIVIAIALFMSFILYFVITVQTDKKYDNDMVYEEYYKVDAAYEGEIKKMENAQRLNELPKIENTKDKIEITFPHSFNYTNGKVSFYRPSDKKLDFEKPIASLDSSLLIPKSQLAGGRWDIVIEWEMNDKSYLIKNVMYL